MAGSVIKPTPRYEVYSKIFGPPPQLQQSHLIGTVKSEATKLTDSEVHRLKSPSRKRKEIETVISKKKSSSELEPPVPSVLGRPLRNESFAVPAIPVPPGPPQLPPSIQRNNNKRFATLGTSVLPSPTQTTASIARSALPRRSGTFGSALPVPATRRSTRAPKTAKTPTVGVKSAVTNTATKGSIQSIQSNSENTTLLNGRDAAVITEKPIIPPPVENTQTENITMDRPKGKLGGAQRVNRNGDSNGDSKGENKKVLSLI